MRTLSLLGIAVAGLLLSGKAFAVYHIGGGVYCSRSSVTAGDNTIYNYYSCYDSSDGGGGGGGEPGSYPGGGGGGSGTAPDNPASIADTPDDPNSPPANRCSDEFARHDHANRDWRTAVARLMSPLRSTPAGRKVRITYDDGSSELWYLSGALMTEPFPGGPVPGTLKGGNANCGGGGLPGGGPGGMCIKNCLVSTYQHQWMKEEEGTSAAIGIAAPKSLIS